MKYQKQILEAFTRLNYEPREGQIFAINEIVTTFLDDKITNVILNASTGTGKSIIGAVVAEVMSKAPDSTKNSIMLTATNILAKQYNSTFQNLQKQNKFIILKGSNNYECTACSTDEESATAETCANFTMMQNYSDFADILENECAKCEYLTIKNKKNFIRHCVTNYSYYFIDRLYTGKFEDRDVVIWDEAHLINDLFSDHNTIVFSQKSIQKAAQEIADVVQITDLEIAKICKSISDDLAIKDKINEINFKSYLNALLKVYRYAKQKGEISALNALRANNLPTYNKLSRFIKSFEGRACKIDDYFKYNYDSVFEYKPEEKLVSIKPIFVGNMIEALQSAPHNLFMSATISEEFACTTLNLDPQKTKFIKLPPYFSKENKEIVFFDPLSLNYTNMQDQSIIQRLVSNVKKIVDKHTSLGEKGIILVPSFKLTQIICADLPKIKFKCFEHKQGEKLEFILEQFKQYKDGPAILCSPSLFEGIDLPGDLSRFQILVKAPYPSLVDKRMKYVLDNYPSLYNIITIMKIVQGAGRSVRSNDDFATTYILDLNVQRLFNSKQNIWKDEFNIRFTKFI